MRFCLFVLFFWTQTVVFAHINTYAIDKDSAKIATKTESVVKKKKNYRPLFSALMSTAIPGAGQMYNKKYWKLPTIWAILAIPISFTVYAGVMHTRAIDYYWYLEQDAFDRKVQAEIAQDPDYLNTSAYQELLSKKKKPPKNANPKNYAEYFPGEDQEQLRSTIDFYKNNFDLALVASILGYLLNILDAFADGYFYKYDINERLALRLTPAAMPSSWTYNGIAMPSYAPALKIQLRF